jgi:hypothetical protein
MQQPVAPNRPREAASDDSCSAFSASWAEPSFPVIVGIQLAQVAPRQRNERTRICAWRSWCGEKRRRTPASRATWRSSVRAAAAQGHPRVADAIQRSDPKAEPRLKPRLKLFPPPVVHADLAAAAALAASHQQRSAARVEVGLGNGERLADPQALQSTTIGPRSRRPWTPSPARRVRVTISSIVRGIAGLPLLGGRRGIAAAPPVSDGGRRHRAATRT